MGEIATLDTKSISKQAVKIPLFLGDVMHIDIGYGCQPGIGGIKYALFVVDQSIRHTYT